MRALSSPLVGAFTLANYEFLFAKPTMDMSTIEGFQSMNLTWDERMVLLSQRRSVKHLWRNAWNIYGGWYCFLPRYSFNRRAVHDSMRRAWRMNSDLRVVDVGSDILQLQFPTASQRDWVFDNGLWTFENDLLLLLCWEEGMHASNALFTQVHL